MERTLPRLAQGKILPEEVHLWIVQPFLELPPRAEDRQVLAEAERQKADRFHRKSDRTRYIADHALLRRLLGNYLEKSPSVIEFDYNPYGKPMVRFESSPTLLHFNLSHTEDFTLLAFSASFPLGVDVEKIRLEVAQEDIANRFFSTLEKEFWQNQPMEKRTSVFFELWTAKEAYLKAIGSGLSRNLDSFSVIPDDQHAGWKVLQQEPLSAEILHWVQKISFHSDYVAALAVPQRNYPLIINRLPGAVEP